MERAASAGERSAMVYVAKAYDTGEENQITKVSLKLKKLQLQK